jgi:hypothetical protein
MSIPKTLPMQGGPLCRSFCAEEKTLVFSTQIPFLVSLQPGRQHEK